MTQITLTKNDQLYLQIIEDLHSEWQPHDAQVVVSKAIFNEPNDIVFCQNGRKWGKTEQAAYALWRFALLNPGSSCYYICPELSHGRELVWANQRLQKFMGKAAAKYIRGKPHNQEMRINLKNGSFIKVFGSENWSAANGLTPDFAVYDEMKIFHPFFHTEFNPNRLAKKAPLLVIGTPPKVGDRNRDQYMNLAEETKYKKNCKHFRRTSYDNPHIDPTWLDEEKENLFRKGEHDVWYREYEGKIVVGGKQAIFPMFDEDRYVRPHVEVYKEIKRDLRKLEWYCVADPGTTTCFATLYAAINPYTKKMYILDEIYEKDQLSTSVRKIYPRMDYSMAEFYPNSSVHDDWTKVYDEAAVWFMNEVMSQYGVYFMPTQKHLNKKEDGLSLIKDQFIFDLVMISDRCQHLIQEISNYAKDAKGKIPKENDHLIDCFRYLNSAANYNMVEALERVKQKNDADRGMRRMEDDWDAFKKEDDWTFSIDKILTED